MIANGDPFAVLVCRLRHAVRFFKRGGNRLFAKHEGAVLQRDDALRLVQKGRRANNGKLCGFNGVKFFHSRIHGNARGKQRRLAPARIKIGLDNTRKGKRHIRTAK